MIKFNKKWNVIPIKRGHPDQKENKKPLINWYNYQNKIFPNKNLHLYEPCNYGVICGKISNNLVIIDFDFENKPLFKNIIKDLRVHFPEASHTLIVATPHGLHIYYHLAGQVPRRQTGLKSPFKEIKAIDILGEGGYALIPPSQIGDDLYYTEVIGNKPATITRELFDKIINFYATREDENETFIPKKNIKIDLNKLRKPFQDILKGKINIEKLSKETNAQEFIYWKYTFLEGMNSGIINKPQDFYPLLRANQPAFDMNKCEEQIPHHIKPNTRPLTNKKLRLYFPSYDIQEPLEDWVVIAKNLTKEFDLITMEDTGDIMIRRGNIYTLETKDFFKSLREQLTAETYGKAYKTKRESILTWIKDGTQFSREDFCYERWLINFKNGHYSVTGKRFVPHKENKDKLFFYEVPFEYKEGGHFCPKFSKLLEEWLGKKNVVKIEDMFEMIGYSMTMNTDMKIAFFIYGDTHTGKSSFQNILGSLIGDRNIASTEIQRLNRDQFGTDELQFKILNMIGDMSDKIVNDLSAFKMITGGDIYIPAEGKGGKRYRFKNAVKVWYNGNYLPKIKNMYDDAFFERWILINFPHQFPVDTDDSIKAIWETVIEDEDEMQGIIHKAIEGAMRLYNRGYFRPELRAYTKHIWKYNSDDIYAFINDKCIEGRDEAMDAGELHDGLNTFLHKRKKPPLSPYKIKTLLEEYGIHKLRSSSGERTEYYNGIGWKPDPPEPIYNKIL